MTPELGRKLLRAYHRLGIMDCEGFPLCDWWLDPRLDRIAADAGIELDENWQSTDREPIE